MDYFSHQTYRTYLSVKEEFKSRLDSFTFSSYYYKGALVTGDTCPSWKTYKDDSLNLPFKDIKFNKVSLRVDYYNFANKANRSVLATCNTPTQVQAMITSLRTGNSLEVNCNDRTWRVFSCQNNIIFCVNCKRVCVNTEVCPGTSFVVNPCTSCATHAAAATLVNFEYGFLKTYPQFPAPLQVVNAMFLYRTNFYLFTHISH